MRKVFLSLTLLILLLFTGCTPGMPVDESLVRSFLSEANVIQGTVGETMHTAWFDFTVTSSQTAEEYGGQLPEDNAIFLVVHIQVENTIEQAIPLYAADFMLLWPEGTDNALVGWTDTQFPQEYTLNPGETVEYDAVYQVPADGITVPSAAEDAEPTDSSTGAGIPSYAIYFREFFEDAQYGSQFCVIVSPEPEPTEE